MPAIQLFRARFAPLSTAIGDAPLVTCRCLTRDSTQAGEAPASAAHNQLGTCPVTRAFAPERSLVLPVRCKVYKPPGEAKATADSAAITVQTAESDATALRVKKTLTNAGDLEAAAVYSQDDRKIIAKRLGACATWYKRGL